MDKGKKETMYVTENVFVEMTHYSTFYKPNNLLKNVNIHTKFDTESVESHEIQPVESTYLSHLL